MMGSRLEKSLLILFLVLGSVLLWLGVSNNQQRFLSSEKPLRIAVSTSPLSSPVIIAARMGYFDEQGLTVELLPIKGGNACFDVLMRGDAELATSSETVIMFNSFERDDFSVLASFAESDNDIKLLVRREDNIRHAADLQHHRIGLVRGSASEYFFDSLLMMNGNDKQPLERLNIAPGELPGALMASAVDAIAVWEPFAFQLLQQYPDKIYTFETKGIYNLSFHLLSRREDIQPMQQQHTRLLRALDDAIQFIADRPIQARAIVSAYLKVPEAELTALWPDYLFRLSLGNTLLSDLQAEARWAMAAKLVQGAMPDYRRYIETDALEKAVSHPLVRKQ